jgi:hypothetical protein
MMNWINCTADAVNACLKMCVHAEIDSGLECLPEKENIMLEWNKTHGMKN